MKNAAPPCADATFAGSPQLRLGFEGQKSGRACRPDRTTRQAVTCSIPNRGGLPANSNSSVVENTCHLHVAHFLAVRIATARTQVNRPRFGPWQEWDVTSSGL